MILLLSSPPRDRPLLQPARAADHGGQAAGRQAGRARPPAVQHRQPGRPLAGAVARQRGAPSCWRSPRTCCGPTRSTTTTCAAGSTGAPTSTALHPDAATRLRRPSSAALASDYARYTLRVRGRGEPGAGRADPRARRDRRDAGIRLAAAHLALGGGRQPRRLAGRAGPVLPQRAHRQRRHGGRHQPQRLGQVHRPRLRRARGARDAGTSCSGRRSTRCRPTRCRSCCRTCCKDGRGALDVYFTRVYNPVWTNPDGFIVDRGADRTSTIGLHVALTPTWSETATFADYVLPMGHATERHDTHSYETHAAKWLGFRQPVRRVAMEQLGMRRSRHPGQQPRRGLGGERVLVRALLADRPRRLARASASYFESPYRPGEKVTVDEYYRWIFENRVPGLPEKAAEQGLTPLAYMRKYGVVEIAKDVYRQDERPLTDAERADAVADEQGVLRKPSTDDSTPPLVGEAGSVGVRLDDGSRGRRLAHPQPSARAVVRLGGVVRLARARDADLHRVARVAPPDRHRGRRDGAGADVPAADPDPHPLRQRQVPQRDQQHPSAVGARRRRRAARRRDRRPGAGHDADRSLRRPRVGAPRASGPAWSRSATTWVAGASTTSTPAGGPAARSTSTAPTTASGGCGTPSTRQAVRERRPRQRADLLGRPRRPPEPHLPGAARPVVGRPLLAPEGDRRPRPPTETGTATSRSTPDGRAPSTRSGWP